METRSNQWRIYEIRPSPIERETQAFLIDRQALGLSEGTLRFYREKLGLLLDYLTPRNIGDVESLCPRTLRAYILSLSKTHNPGGVHATYRAMRAFVNWWEDEVEPEDWKNPLRKVHPPKVRMEPLDPVPLPDIKTMLSVCPRRTLTGDRDRAILLCLLDSGCRRAEFLALDIGDVNGTTGSVLVRSGKGGKPRTTLFGAKSRRALSTYLRHRPTAVDSGALWVTRTHTRLTPNGLREGLGKRPTDATAGTGHEGCAPPQRKAIKDPHVHLL